MKTSGIQDFPKFAMLISKLYKTIHPITMKYNGATGYVIRSLRCVPFTACYSRANRSFLNNRVEHFQHAFEGSGLRAAVFVEFGVVIIPQQAVVARPDRLHDATIVRGHFAA